MLKTTRHPVDAFIKNIFATIADALGIIDLAFKKIKSRKVMDTRERFVF